MFTCTKGKIYSIWAKENNLTWAMALIFAEKDQSSSGLLFWKKAELGEAKEATWNPTCLIVPKMNISSVHAT